MSATPDVGHAIQSDEGFWVVLANTRPAELDNPLAQEFLRHDILGEPMTSTVRVAVTRERDQADPKAMSSLQPTCHLQDVEPGERSNAHRDVPNDDRSSLQHEVNVVSKLCLLAHSFTRHNR